MSPNHTSNKAISEANICDNLITIFPDSIILKNGFKVVAVSKQIADLLGFQQRDLVDQPIHSLSEDHLFARRLEKELTKGYFDNFIAVLSGKKKKGIPCKLSGSYLGLISEINGFAILKVKPLDEQGQLNKQLEASRNELDEFVYRTTHDLRGPLATMRGLINLMKRETSLEDLKYLVELLDVQAKVQDDRLYNLSYLSVSDQTKILEHTLDCPELESTLRSTLEENLLIDGVDFRFDATDQQFEKINSRLTMALLTQLLLYLVNLPKGPDPGLSYDLRKVDGGVKIVVTARDFHCSYQLRQAINKRDPLYTTIIVYPQLINFFAAQKTAQRLNATIDLDVEEDNQRLFIRVPGLRISNKS